MRTATLALVQHRGKPRHNKQQVAFHQAHGNRVADGFQDAQPGGLGLRLLAALLFLRGLHRGIGVRPPLLLLGVMHRAIGIGAHLADFALVRSVRNDGLGGVLACLVFRRVLLVFVFWLLLPDFDILVARHNRAAFGGFAVGGRDLYQLRFGCYGFLDVRIQLGRIAGRVRAGVRVFADTGKEQRVVPGPLWALKATARCGHKLRVALAERRVFQDEQDVLLNPVLKMAHREQDALCLVAIAPIFAKASGKGLLLFRGLQLRQEKRMADSDLVLQKSINRDGRKLSQSQTGGAIRRRFSRFGCD